MFNAEELGSRTKRIVAMVADKITQLTPEIDRDDAEKKASAALKSAGLKIKSADKGTDALFFMSESQAASLAKLVVDGENDKEKYRTVNKNMIILLVNTEPTFSKTAARDESN